MALTALTSLQIWSETPLPSCWMVQFCFFSRCMQDSSRSKKTWSQAAQRKLSDCVPSRPHPRTRARMLGEMAGGEGGGEGGPGGDAVATCSLACLGPGTDRAEDLEKGDPNRLRARWAEFSCATRSLCSASIVPGSGDWWTEDACAQDLPPVSSQACEIGARGRVWS